jgi:hypothetical protein
MVPFKENLSDFVLGQHTIAKEQAKKIEGSSLRYA